MAWKVTLCKVEVEEQEFSLHENFSEALAAAGELEDEMGLDEPAALQSMVQRCPATGKLMMIIITGGQDV